MFGVGLLSIFLISSICFGQVAIEGFVVDAKTYEPIVGAEVVFKLFEGGKFVSEERISTDGNGYYIAKFDSVLILNQLKVLIIAMKGGYKDFKKEVDLNKEFVKLDLYMLPLEYTLDTVTVEASKTFLIPTYRLQAIDLQNLPILVETDVLRSVWFLPGITGQNDLTSSFSIRGGDPNYNIILIDGIRMLNPYHFGGLASAINPDIVGNINLFTGAYPPDYSGTISGIVDISTKELNISRFSLNASLSFLSSKLSINLPISSLGFISGFRRTYYDIFGFPYYFWDFHLKTFYELGKSKFRFFTYLSRDVFEFLKYERFSEWRRKVKDKPLTWGNSIYGLRWIYKDRKIKTEILVYFTSFITQADAQVDWVDHWSGIVEKQEVAYVGNRVINYGGKFNLYFTDEAIDLSSNLNFELLNLKYVWDINFESLSGLVDPPQEVFFDFAPPVFNYIWRSWTAGGFLNLKFKTKYKFYTDLGLRTDYLRWLDKAILTPYVKIGHLYGSVDIFLALKRNYQMLVEFGERLRGEIYSEFKLSFPTERNAYPYSTDLCFGAEHNDPSGKLNIKGEIYWQKRLRVQYINEIDLNKNFYEETSLGLDVFLKSTYSKFYSTISYSFNRVIREQEGAKFPGNYDLRHNLKIFTAVNLSANANLSLSWIFNSGLPYSKPSLLEMALKETPHYFGAKQPIHIYLNSFRNSSYHRLDVTFKYRFNAKVGDSIIMIEPFLTVINLYARKNKIFLGFDERVYDESYFDGFPFSAIIGFNFSL